MDQMQGNAAPQLQEVHVDPESRIQDQMTMSHFQNMSTASKRMANGDVKSPGASLSLSPTSPAFGGHSRTISNTSRTSQIGEVCLEMLFSLRILHGKKSDHYQLSNNLRTRLSYAMVKVQHGWESHSIDHLEKSFSERNSPATPTAHQAQKYDAPTSHAFSADWTPNVSPQKRLTETAYENGHPPSRNGLVPKTQQSSQNDPANTGGTYQNMPSGPTYESFWQQHSADPVSTARQKVVPSLAPPVDILPRTRPVESTNRQRPFLDTNFPDSMQKFPGQLPSTPSHRTTLSKIRTPSQQAAVEKDVVESLLFMSSPGNSQSYPASQPLAAAISPPRDRLVRPDRIGKKYLGSPLQRRKPTQSSFNDAEISKMIDEMPDSSSSDESEPVRLTL